MTCLKGKAVHLDIRPLLLLVNDTMPVCIAFIQESLLFRACRFLGVISLFGLENREGKSHSC